MRTKILFPSPLRRGDTIGITAPSAGVSEPSHLERMDLILSQLKARGYQIREGRCLRTNHKHVSGSAKDRAQDLAALWTDPAVKAIVPPWGGELLIDMLKEMDFAELAATAPKWILGYSDTSTLLFALTLKTHIATAHGSNLMDLIENQTDDQMNFYYSTLGLAAGSRFEQKSFPRYQSKWTKWEGNLTAPFNLEHDVVWKSLHGRPAETMSGRLMGGCIDTIMHLIGTPYGELPQFKKSFANDGVILYLENCELPPCMLARALWQMRYADWFTGLKGIVFGRSSGPDKDKPEQLNYREAIESVLGGMNIPVLLDADIGHQPPQMLLINGALAQIKFESGKALVAQELA